jgi:hypothetical protein
MGASTLLQRMSASEVVAVAVTLVAVSDRLAIMRLHMMGQGCVRGDAAEQQQQVCQPAAVARGVSAAAAAAPGGMVTEVLLMKNRQGAGILPQTTGILEIQSGLVAAC